MRGRSLVALLFTAPIVLWLPVGREIVLVMGSSREPKAIVDSSVVASFGLAYRYFEADADSNRRKREGSEGP